MPRPLKHPQIRQLVLGGSCFIPGEHINSIINRIGHYKPLRFSCRTVMLHGMVGVRVRGVA